MSIKEGAFGISATDIRLAQILIKTCAFNMKSGTNALHCTHLTRVVSKNPKCCAIKCTSPERVCRVCVAISANPGKVTDPESGLCDFHLRYGEQSRKEIEKEGHIYIRGTAPKKSVFEKPSLRPIQEFQWQKATAFQRLDVIAYGTELVGMTQSELAQQWSVHAVMVSQHYALRKIVPSARVIFEKCTATIPLARLIAVSKMNEADQVQCAQHWKKQ